MYRVLAVAAMLLASLSLFVAPVCADHGLPDWSAVLPGQQGIVCLLGTAPEQVRPSVQQAQQSEVTLYVQAADEAVATAAREAAEALGLLGTRIFVTQDELTSIHLADNLADAIVAAADADVPDAELLRVLRPQATALVGERRLTKPLPTGTDDWSHVYHGPDNNPQSRDTTVRGELTTQFIAGPTFSPMPEQTVVAGGRIFKAMGHIAHKANQNEMLNSLLGINGYNGTILWHRPLPEGFMLHRNTMIATDDALYMADHESCKVFDAVSGEIRRQIVVPAGISDGPVWKWMGMQGGVLYALVGSQEVHVDTQRSNVRGLGHWPWDMWQGHDYSDPRTSFGFGRTILALEPSTGRVLWHYRDEDYLDARGVCMNAEHLFCYSPEKFLACIDRATGKLLWKNDSRELLDAIGPNGKAQQYITGYATTCYVKCTQDYVFFAGPQRERMVVASARDGSLAWTDPRGNLQLVLRDDAVYAAGPEQTYGSRLDYATGRELSRFPGRRACTRATGCADSIFFRATGGTVRVMTDSNTAQHIAPMRPPCQDGVIISNGMLYWGPWMCGCQLSLYGHIGLAPTHAPARSAAGAALYAEALQVNQTDTDVTPLDSQPGDWTTYRADNRHSDQVQTPLPDRVKLQWSAEICASELPTAPVVAGGLVFIADRTGIVRALDRDGQTVWKSYTGGPIYYPPVVAHDRLYVGSADGRVYAWEARTGRPLWTFRVAPEDRRIPVFGKLISRWPVAGGVVADQGTVYAAAGIAHYDGTYVVALDAVTGQLKACNTQSGTLAPQVNGGISLQGDLTLVDGELHFLGGGVYETARYDLKTLACLNEPKAQVFSQYQTAFYPYYPTYGKYVSLRVDRGDGTMLTHEASYEGSAFRNLALTTASPDEATPNGARAAQRRRGQGAGKAQTLWQDQQDRRFTSFIVSRDRLLAAGHPDDNPAAAFLAAIQIREGSDAWVQPLPANAVKGGTAVDGEGRILVALENGQLLCFVPDRS